MSSFVLVYYGCYYLSDYLLYCYISIKEWSIGKSRTELTESTEIVMSNKSGISVSATKTVFFWITELKCDF